MEALANFTGKCEIIPELVYVTKDRREYEALSKFHRLVWFVESEDDFCRLMGLETSIVVLSDVSVFSERELKILKCICRKWCGGGVVIKGFAEK
jgi:hypothetical protein